MYNIILSLYKILGCGSVNYIDYIFVKSKDDLYEIVNDMITDPHDHIYNREIKKFIKENYSDIYNELKNRNPDVDFNDEDIEISLVSGATISTDFTQYRCFKFYNE